MLLAKVLNGTGTLLGCQVCQWTCGGFMQARQCLDRSLGLAPQRRQYISQDERVVGTGNAMALAGRNHHGQQQTQGFTLGVIQNRGARHWNHVGLHGRACVCCRRARRWVRAGHDGLACREVERAQRQSNRLASRCFIWSATYRARAWIVEVGFTPAEVTKMLPSTMNRFLTSWLRPHSLTTE